ncbi:MAG: hypothetical protein M3N68_14820 [Actinomycetota bacterium]|nr:hypothetical protein [Actinomycetota bacterium]
MLIACWSVKGGSGTTVVAAALALILARSAAPGTVAVDLAGDLPAVLGLPEPTGAGVSDWLGAGPDVPSDALARLEVDAGQGLRLLPRGAGPLAAAGGERLASALCGHGRVVVDCSSGSEPVGLAVAASASLSLLVLRPCYLALRRALAAPLRPSGVILVDEPGRSLGRGDVEEVLGVPVRARVAWDPTVARCVDAGLLAGRVPRALERALRQAA